MTRQVGGEVPALPREALDLDTSRLCALASSSPSAATNFSSCSPICSSNRWLRSDRRPNCSRRGLAKMRDQRHRTRQLAGAYASAAPRHTRCPFCHNTLISQPRRPRITNRWPFCGLRCSVSCTSSASLSKPIACRYGPCQPDLHTTRDRDHRRSTSVAIVLIIPETIAGSAAPAIRIRAPLATQPFSIMLDAAASGTTATGANPGGSRAGPHSCCRQLNNRLT